MNDNPINVEEVKIAIINNFEDTEQESKRKIINSEP